MSDHRILLSPAANRVYAKSSIRLLQSEIRVFNDAVLGGKVQELAETTIGGVPYIALRSEPLSAQDIAYLSNLSSLYALFEAEGELLRPVTIEPLDKFGSDLLTTQKYAGKTNEHFTKLLFNVTAVSTDAPAALLSGRQRVLDPMCGRGTTLNQAMMYGLDVTGVDIDSKDFEAYSVFLETWLKNNRVKHKVEHATIRRDRERLGRRLDVSVGLSKEQFKAGSALRVSYVNGDTRRCADFFKADSFDVLVADAPYGVQHGSRSRQLARSPLELLTEALPAWARVLRPGGALGISWNTYVAKRAELAAILADNGFVVRDSAGFDDFAHRVDQAINRDLIVARKS
jgi:SAM-dependent methyltransferase